MEHPSNPAHTPAYQTAPLHQYTTVQPNTVQAGSAQAVPVQVYPVTPVKMSTTSYPAKAGSYATPASMAASAGIFGFVVVSTGTMGANLNKVGAGEMTMGQAAGDSLVKGAIGGTAAACATAASTSLTSGGVAGLAVTVAAATGVSYLINRIIS